MTTFSFASVAAVVALAALCPPARADITVMENRKTLEVDCAKDPEVNLLGNHIQLTTKGVCTKITITGNHETVIGSSNAVFVTGNHNTVTMEAADDVSIMGNHNTVSVRKAVTRKAPQIGNVGNHNKVTRGK